MSLCGATPHPPVRSHSSDYDEFSQGGIRAMLQHMVSEQFEEFRLRLAIVEKQLAEATLAVTSETHTNDQTAIDRDELLNAQNDSKKDDSKINIVMLGDSDHAQEEPTNQAQNEGMQEEAIKDVASSTQPAQQTGSLTLKFLEGTDRYNLEESIYGLLVLPNSPLRFGSCFLVLVFYCLTSGLIMIIYYTMVSEMQDVRAELYDSSLNNDPLCEQVFQGESYTWVCSPPSLVKLMDFNQLDLNGDGIWSVVEARSSSLLMYFRALNEVALEQREILENIFPPSQPIPDSFCMVILPIGTTNANLVHYLSEADHFDMFASTGRLTWDVVEGCNLTEVLHDGPNQYSPMARESYACLLDSVCPDGVPPMLPGSDSVSQFLEATKEMAVVTRSLHKHLSDTMLRPCRLLDSELCANADVQEHSLLRDVWPDLPLDKALEKCSQWVASTCPRLLGEDFKAFHARMGVACGERAYEVVPQEVTTPWQISENTQDLECKDPEDGGKAILAPIVQSIFDVTPAFKYLAWAQESYFGFPRGTVLQMLDCNIGGSGFRFQWTETEYRDPATNATTSVANAFGKACPMTSCKRDWDNAVPFGCPEQCLHKADLANNVTDPFNISVDIGEYTQVGRCTGFHTEVDNVTGALKVSRIYPPESKEWCRILLRLRKTARVYITRWNFPKRKTSIAGTDLCLGDFLMIDGKRYCNTEKPEAVNLEPKAGDFTKLAWAICETCGEFDLDAQGYDKLSPPGFELIIVDAAVPTTHSMVTVSFGVHRWFWSDVQGVTTSIFHLFLVLIMLVWIGYLGDEFFHTMNYMKFILQVFKKERLHRVLLLVFLVLPRFFIWFFVMYTGILLLATVHSYVEIVLNSVALAFVLEFDEYLFVMAIPFSMKQHVKEHEVFMLERWRIEGWVNWGYNLVAYDGKVVSRMLCFIIVAVLLVEGLYAVDWFGSPHFNLIAEVYDCMCALRGPHCPEY